jgi:thiol-disulfide isomerase/thioredoxin
MLACRSLLLLALAAALAACGTEPHVEMPDSGVSDDAAPEPRCAPPSEPYGTTEGRNFRPLRLPRCDETLFSFYGEAEGYCEASFTVLVMSAGWCAPCRVEAPMLQTELADRYADRRVRVISVLIQDDAFAAPSPSFCQSWVNTYGLRFPVLMDTRQVTQVYFPMGALPANLIVDSRGVIRYREYGASAGLRTLRSALDRLLAESGM